MELVSRRRSPPASSPAGAPHAFLSVFLGIRFSRFPGRLIRPAPPLPSVRGARRYITRPFACRQELFSKSFERFEVPPFLLSIMLSERRNPRSPQTRVSHYSYSVLPPQDLFYTSLMNFRLPTCRTQSFSFSGSTLYTLGATASPLSFTPPPSMRRRASPTLCARPAS